MSPVVSIYIPTHNRRALLERAVASVLAQDYPHIEVLIANDGSTDDTRPYLDALAAREPRVRALHIETASGAPAARNRAIAVANGAFLTGLDDDDEFLPGRLSQFLKCWQGLEARNVTCACLYTGCIAIHGARRDVDEHKPRQVSYFDLFRLNVIGNQVFAPTAHFRAVGGFDVAMPAWQDLDLFLRMLMRFGDARLAGKPTYVQHVESGLTRISASRVRVRRAFERLSGKYPELPTSLRFALYLQRFSNYYGIVPSLGDIAYLVRHRFPMSDVVTLIRIAREVLGIKLRWRWNNRTIARSRPRRST